MAVGSSSNWYACHWYMGAYFTRLADLRGLRVCYLTLLSPFFSFPLVQVSFLFYWLFLSFFLLFFLSLVLLPSSTNQGDRATNMSGELCLPFVKILDVSLIGTSGGSHAQRGKKVAMHAWRYEEPLTTASNPHGIMTMAGQNLLSKRS